MSNRFLKIDEKIHKYILDYSLNEPKILKKLRLETLGMTKSTMQISPEQGQFMRLMILTMKAKKILEIGVFRGYSSLSMALGLPEDGKIIACDINNDYVNVAKHYWELAGVSSKIDLRLGPALETIDDLKNEKKIEYFDLAFIDADKANYLNYYNSIFPLIKKRGVILIDNVLWSGSVADNLIQNKDTNAIRMFNEVLCSDKRINLSMLPIGDGLTIAYKI